MDVFEILIDDSDEYSIVFDHLTLSFKSRFSKSNERSRLSNSEG